MTEVAAGGKLSLWEQNFATLFLFFQSVGLCEPPPQGRPCMAGYGARWVTNRSDMLRYLSWTLSLLLARQLRAAEGCSPLCRLTLKGGSGMLRLRAPR